MDSIRIRCPYCGEPAELDIEADGGSPQAYVQDCPVCCRPWQVEVRRDRQGGWHASARSDDE